MTEFFLQYFIINESDILFIVVGKLTYSEQLLINKIKIEAKKQNKDRIFIIHNLQEFITKKQVEDYIKNTLLKCSTFNLNSRTWITTKKDNDEIQEDKILEKKENEKEDSNEVKKEDEKEIINEEKELNNLVNNENNINIDNLNKNDDNIPLNENNLKIHNDNININNEIPKEQINEIKDDNNINPENEIVDINEKNADDEGQFENIHFTEILRNGTKKLEVYHLIMANEDYEEVQVYNKYVYNFIENLYNLVPEPKTFDVFDKVKDDFKKLSVDMLNENIKTFLLTKNEDIIKDKVIKLEQKDKLKLKRCYIDELGFSLFKTGNFEPKYNCFKPDENTLEIRLEIPGNCTCNFSNKIEQDKTIIIVKGKKDKDKKPENIKDNIYNIREFTDFEVIIPLKVEDYPINKPKQEKPIIKNGVCIIQYELISKVEEQSFEVDEKI